MLPHLVQYPSHDMGSIYLTYLSLCSHIRHSNCHTGTGRGYGFWGRGCRNGKE